MKHVTPCLLTLCMLWWMISCASGEKSLLVISDLHMTQQTQPVASTLVAIEAATARHQVSLWLGDNTNNAKTEEHQLVVGILNTLARDTGAEIYVIPGNHDYSSHYTPQDFVQQYGAYGWNRAFARDLSTASCAVMTNDGLCLLLLDTNQYDTPSHVLPGGGLTDETLRWVTDTLDALPEGTPVIACGHHPILPESRREQTENADQLARLLADRGVRLYLCGHDHGYHTVEAMGLRQITVGQPHTYPGWAGEITSAEHGFLWQVVELYTPDQSFYQALLASSSTLAQNMAQGTLSGTVHENDEGAIRWFEEVFLASTRSELTPERCAAFLADPNCRKWREIETHTVVKAWILSLLENCPEDVRTLRIVTHERMEDDMAPSQLH